MDSIISFKGKPVFTLRTGCFPNVGEIKQIIADHPNCLIKTEPFGNRFVVTVREINHVR